MKGGIQHRFQLTLASVPDRARGGVMRKCPFCGMGCYRDRRGQYMCGSTERSPGHWSRSNQCHETQLARQAELLGRALEVVKGTHSLIRLINLWIAKHSTDKTWKQYQDEINPTTQEKELMALIPNMEKALEEVK